MTSSPPLVIFGVSEFAEVAHYYFTRDGSRSVAAFTVDGTYIRERAFHGLPVVAFEEVENVFLPSEYEVFVAVAYKKMNKLRAEKCSAAREKGYSLASFVSSRTSCLEPPRIGANCFIFEDNTIQPYVTIGDNVIIWSGNHIGHHTQIGNHVFIASHVCIAGSVVIGDYSFLGVNATIRDGVSIAPECLIGAGALILKDTTPNEVYAVTGTSPHKRKSNEIDF